MCRPQQWNNGATVVQLVRWLQQWNISSSMIKKVVCWL